MDRFDDIDERILAELAEHARATFAEIGEKVNLSAPAVKRRVDRMLDSGVIKGFTTVIDRNALGWNTEAYVQVFCHGTIAPDDCARRGSTSPRWSARQRLPVRRMRSCTCWPATCSTWRRRSNASAPAPTSSAAKASWCCPISSSGRCRSARAATPPRRAIVYEASDEQTDSHRRRGTGGGAHGRAAAAIRVRRADHDRQRRGTPAVRPAAVVQAGAAQRARRRRRSSRGSSTTTTTSRCARLARCARWTPPRRR